MLYILVARDDNVRKVNKGLGRFSILSLNYQKRGGATGGPPALQVDPVECPQGACD